MSNLIQFNVSQYIPEYHTKSKAQNELKIVSVIIFHKPDNRAKLFPRYYLNRLSQQQQKQQQQQQQQQ